MSPVEIIEAFDRFLLKKKLSFKGIVIGGAALNLLGVISRETRDCDILDPVIPKDILTAAVEFSKTQQGIDCQWLNNGPDSLKTNLPKGWKKRIQPLFSGEALHLETLGRSDLLKTKLYAYCDRDTDLSDCLALKPTRQELLEALPWVQFQDANPKWPQHVQSRFGELATRLGYGL